MEESKAAHNPGGDMGDVEIQVSAPGGVGAALSASASGPVGPVPSTPVEPPYFPTVQEFQRDLYTAISEAVRLTTEMLSKHTPYTVDLQQDFSRFLLVDPIEGRSTGTLTFSFKVTDPARVMHAEAIKALSRRNRGKSPCTLPS